MLYTTEITTTSTNTPTTSPTIATTTGAEFTALTDLITPGLTTCGAAENKIINGVEVIQNSWPWIVGIFRRDQDAVDNDINSGGLCSGTIIDDRWILTSAQCCEDVAEFQLFLGDHDRLTWGETDGTEKWMIADAVVMHPERDSNANNFDACLLRTPEPIGIGSSPGVAAACLPTEGPKHGEACWTAGWGINENGTYSSELRSIGVNIFSDEYCIETHALNDFAIASDEFCAGLPDSNDADSLADGGKDTCVGDSGGPLVCNRNGALTLTGIVSGERNCAEKGKPRMYGDVFEYNDWIRSVINVPITTAEPVTLDLSAFEALNDTLPTGWSFCTVDIFLQCSLRQ